jgi:hypothetical protein
MIFGKFDERTYQQQTARAEPPKAEQRKPMPIVVEGGSTSEV